MRVVPQGGLLAVHAHPDDETLWTGALLATWAAVGEPVAVVTCTRGERGEVLTRPGTTSEGQGWREGNGSALAAYRTGELSEALTALRGSSPVQIGHFFLDELPHSGRLSLSKPSRNRFEDSGMVWVAPGIAGPDPSVPSGFAHVPVDDAARPLAALIDDLKPSVVVTYEPGGGYGHPDHVHCAAVTRRALASATHPCPLWEAVVPTDVYHATRADLENADDAATAVAAAGLHHDEPGDDDPPMVAPESPAELVAVDLEPVLDRVMAAMRVYASQVRDATVVDGVPGVRGFFGLSNGVVIPVRQQEYYRVVEPAKA